MRPEWREWAVSPPAIASKETEAEIVTALNEIVDAPRLSAEPRVSLEEASSMVVSDVSPCIRANGEYSRQK